jgi:hypothetical protein
MMKLFCHLALLIARVELSWELIAALILMVRLRPVWKRSTSCLALHLNHR